MGTETTRNDASKGKDLTKRKRDPSAKSANSNSSETSSNKKRAVKVERQSHRRHFDDVSKAKEIWNKLRVHSNKKNDVKKHMKELMVLLNGKMAEVALKHDSSRVVQAAVQYGSTEQRASILKELKTSIVELAKSQYAHFVVLKLIKYCGRDAESRGLFVKALKGNMCKLVVHVIGSRVVELLFVTFPPKSITLLRQELYGPQFALFSSGSFSDNSSLNDIVTKYPEKRDSVRNHVHELVEKGIEKGFFNFAYFQKLVWEYVESSTPNEIREFASSVVDHSIHMLSTRCGAKVISQCAGYGTVKDRRRILKSLKGYARSSLLHADGYIAFLRMCDVTDDTVAIQKFILNELLTSPSDSTAKGDEKEKESETEEASPILDLALSSTACKLFYLLLSTKNSALFDPYELEMLKPAEIEENGATIPTSKKNPTTRQKELQLYLRAALCNLCQRHAAELARSASGAKLLLLVHRSFPSRELADALVEACLGSMSEEESIFEDGVGHRCVKNLLLEETRGSDGGKRTSRREAPVAESELSLASVFCETFGGKLMEVASCNRGAFVVAALADVDAVRELVSKELQSSLPVLREKGKTMKGFELLTRLLEAKK